MAVIQNPLSGRAIGGLAAQAGYGQGVLEREALRQRERMQAADNATRLQMQSIANQYGVLRQAMSQRHQMSMQNMQTQDMWSRWQAEQGMALERQQFESDLEQVAEAENSIREAQMQGYTYSPEDKMLRSKLLGEINNLRTNPTLTPQARMAKIREAFSEMPLPSYQPPSWEDQVKQQLVEWRHPETGKFLGIIMPDRDGTGRVTPIKEEGVDYLSAWKQASSELKGEGMGAPDVAAIAKRAREILAFAGGDAGEEPAAAPVHPQEGLAQLAGMTLPGIGVISPTGTVMMGGEEVTIHTPATKAEAAMLPKGALYYSPEKHDVVVRGADNGVSGR